MAPVDATVLLAGAADALDAVQGCVLLLETLEDKVEGLEPEGYGGKDLAFLFIDEDALFDLVFGAKVLVEVDFGGGDDGEVGLDDDGFGRLVLAREEVLESLGVPLSCWVERSNPR